MKNYSVNNRGLAIVLPANLQHNRAPGSRTWYLARELKNSGIRTVIIGREAESDPISGDNVITVKPLLGRGFVGNLVFLFQFWIVVVRFLFDTKIDRVFARDYSLAPLFPVLRLWRKVIIYDFHDYAYKDQIIEGRRLRAVSTRLFDWLALKLADHIVAIREELIQDLPQDFQRKTLLLPNGVDLDEFAAPEKRDVLARYGLPTDKRLVGFIGNFEAWVAIEDVLGLTEYLNEKTKVVIIGAGERFQEYKAAYPSILFTGMVPHRDAVELLKKMDVCVCPYSTQLITKNRSYRKVLEYLAAGKPIVSSDAPGREKFLKEGENTLLYRAGQPQDLAEKVNIILNNDELHAKMCRNNLVLAKQFSWQEVLSQSGLIKILQGQRP